MAIDYLETTVVDMFDYWAKRTPDAPAVEWDGQVLTYANVRDASLHASKSLLSVGVRSGDMIPILSRMSLELLPAILAVLRVGACYVPIDTEVWSKARVDATLEDISPQVAIATCQSDIFQVPIILPFQEQWLRSSFYDTDDTCSQLDAVRRSLSKNALVYVTFTSGTTGKPKGVMIYHHALYHFAALTTENTNNTAPGERVLLASCISFDACAATMWSTVTKGGALAMASWSTFPEIATTCDTLTLTPSMFATLDPAGPYDKVRSIFLGSEAANFDIARKWITPTRRVIHTYGPSEATINIAYGRIPEGTEPDMGVINPGAEVFLVDGDMQESETGEILIGGTCVGAGYLNNPELTAKKFIHWNGRHVYRTGDLARRTATGLSWVGRADRVVKNRGFLVNLETEVESGMLRFSNVRAASACMWRAKLMGFVQPATVDVEELRVFMKENFDPFVVPDEIIALEQFPLTAHGKVDRVALNAKLEDRMASEAAELDAMVCESPYDALRWAFAKCLQVPVKDLDRTSSFSRLGGNSLAAIHLSKFLKQQGYAIVIPQIFRRDTINRLETELTKTNEQNGDLSSNVTMQTESQAVIATDMHKIMLTSSQSNPLVSCCLARAKFMGGQTSIRTQTPTPDELRAAWISTLGSHGIFRTRYDVQNWIIHDLGRINLDWEEVSVKAEDFDNSLLSTQERLWTHHRGLQSIDIEVPYCRMICVYAPDRKAIGFVWLMHHVLSDIFSITILMRDLEQALAGKQLAPGPRIQDYSRFMQKFKEKTLGTATAHWKRMVEPLSERSMLKFPQPQKSFKGDAWQILPFATRETVESIEASVRTYNISSATLIIAAWALVLAKYTRSSFAPFILSRSGRMVPWSQAPALVAAMNCRVPFVTDIPPQATVKEWLAEMESALLDVAELENLCQSLDPSICPVEQFNTGVQAFLYMPELPTSWEFHDKLIGHPNVGLVWRVQATGDGVVEAELEVDRRMVDIEWAQEVGTVAVKMLEGLANAQGSTKVQDLKFT